MSKGNGLGPDAAPAAGRIVVDALARIEAASRSTGDLVGDGFTAADLTAASLLAPLCDPDRPTVRRPSPRPREPESLLAQ